MTDLLVWQQSIALYCRQFLDDIEDISIMNHEHEQLDACITRTMELTAYSFDEICVIEEILGRYSMKILNLYAKYPEDTRLDALYRRTGSLRDMCLNLVEHRE